MAFDVLQETVIARSPAEVSAYAGDPSNAPEWWVDIQSAEWKTPPPLGVGSRLEFTVGNRYRTVLAFTYEVVEHVPGERLVMRTVWWPFPIVETTYTWEPAGDGGTRMTLRHRSKPKGFSKVLAPFIAFMRCRRKDLGRLKALLERA